MRVFTPYTPAARLVDFLLNCGVILVATTIYSSSPWLLNLLLALPAAFIFLTTRPPAQKTLSRPPNKNKTTEYSPSLLPVKPFVTHYRGSMMMITCVAILAVDFRVFPRRFGKVENWGTSLMDMGVGSFVFTSGVVSARSSLKANTEARPSLYKRLVVSIRHSIPLLVLGYIRLLSVRSVDYAVHVSEYGVHWNFFFTLGFLPPFSALCQTAFDLIPSYAVLACLIGTAYEIVLDKTALTKFMLTAPRTDLLSKNREGIFSFIGYLAIFLAGQSLGSYTLPRQRAFRKDASIVEVIRQSILGKLVFSAIAWTALFYMSTNYYGLGLSVSRQLANFPYILWVSAFNTANIALCCAIETLCFPNLYKNATKEEEVRKSREATSTILFAFNRNGLTVFLVANLLTGLVNITLPTLHMGTAESMAILVGYIAVVTGVALGLDRLDLSIKL